MTGPTPRRNVRVRVRSSGYTEEYWCTPKGAARLTREWRRCREFRWTVEVWERVAVRRVRRRR